MPDGWMWLLAKFQFPPRAATLHRFSSVHQRMCCCHDMWWTVLFIYPSAAAVFLYIASQRFTTASPTKLLLSLQMRDHTQRGARTQQLTNRIHPGGTASQVQYIQSSHHMWLCFLSHIWFMLCLIYRHPRDEASCHLRARRAILSAVFRLRLHCFECLDKVKTKCLRVHTCHRH